MMYSLLAVVGFLFLSKLLGQQQASPYVVQGPFGFFVCNRDLQSYQKCQCWHQRILQKQNKVTSSGPRPDDH